MKKLGAHTARTLELFWVAGFVVFVYMKKAHTFGPVDLSLAAFQITFTFQVGSSNLEVL